MVEKTYNEIKTIKEYALVNKVPIMVDDSIDFIISKIHQKRVRKVLEIGTAIGYSAIMMALSSPNLTITSIEKEVYMSPSSYLIARNINIIFESIYYSRDKIEEWYKQIEDSKNERVVNIHNNITLDHYIKSEKPYLISWNKSRIDSPIYDLLSFYKNHYLELDFDDLFHYYESSYPLKEEERLLLFSQIAIPSKIELENDEYKMCIKINKMIDYLYKTSKLITNYQKK